MKKHIAFIGIVAASMFSSCSSFLEEDPKDFLGEESFYKTEADAVTGLNGVFGILQSQNYYQRTVWLVTELSGDCLQALSNAGGRQEIQNYTFTDNTAEIGNWWINPYTLIGRANDLLEKVPLIDMDQTKKNVILGNARFLRGMAYFDLVRSFGKVPLVLATIKTPQDDMKPSRAEIDKVYDQIIEDLTFAEANCPLESDIAAAEKGRVSKGAAAAMLAKVYLTRASTAAAETGDKAAALDACNRVISSNQYTLLATYGDIFDCDKENGKEHIFSVQFDLPPNIGNITVQMMYPNEKAVGGGSGAFRANPVFVASYAANDPRKAWNISNKAGDKVLPDYYFYKYRDPRRNGNDSRVNWLVSRYADVLLLKSEALNAIDANDASKFDGINAVRARVGLAPLDFTTTPSSDDFIDALVDERAWELCMEGHRRFDLLRLGRLKQVQQEVYNRIIDDKYLLYPVPQTETTLNPNLLPNNF